MASVNKVILLGNLGRDPETRYTTGGDAVTNLNIATSEQWKDKNGEKQERTEWHRVVLFSRQAEIAGEYLKKGCRCTSRAGRRRASTPTRTASRSTRPKSSATACSSSAAHAMQAVEAATPTSAAAHRGGAAAAAAAADSLGRGHQGSARKPDDFDDDILF